MAEEQEPEVEVAEEEGEAKREYKFEVKVTTASKWWSEKVVDEEGNETTVENESLATTSCSIDLLGLHSCESEAVALGEDGSFDYGLSTTFAVGEEEKGMLLSKVLNKGLVLTLYDAKKEALGSGEVVLESLLTPGNVSVEGSAKIGLLATPEGTEQTEVLLNFALSVSEPLQTAAGGLIGRVEGMKLSPVPESLQKAMEESEVAPDFLVAIQVPGKEEKEVLEFKNGTVSDSALTWSKGMKFFVEPDGVTEMKKMVKSGQFSVEAARYMPAASEHGDPNASAYYFYSDYSIGGLLEPGVQTVGVACKPTAPVVEGEEAPKLHMLPNPEYGEKATPFAEETALEEGQNAWVKAESSLSFSIALDFPLLALWSLPANTVGKLSEFISVKEQPKAIDKMKAKQKAFVNQCKTVAKILIRDYGDAFEEDGGSRTQKNVIFHLNKSGAYAKMKEFLKKSAIDIIEQRIGSSTVIKQMDSHALLNEAYSILLEGVQDALKEMQYKNEEEDKNDENVLQKMKMLADEYELNEVLDIAEKYHVDRISNAKKKTANLWYDYGQFCLRSNMIDKAEECFREELSLFTTMDTLLALAGVLLYQSKTPKGNKYLLDQAEVLIHSALRHEGDESESAHPLAWAMLALLYSKTKGLDSDACQNCIFKATKDKKEIKMGMSSIEVDGMTHLVFQMLDLSLAQVASDALAICETIPEVDKLLCKIQVHYSLGEHEEALEVLAQAVELCDHDDVRPYVLEGKICCKMGNHEGAVQCFTKVMSMNASACTLDVLLTYGKTLMKIGTESSVKTALDVFVFACQKCPCASTWLGCAIACIELEDFANAETALTEASILDAKNAKVWAYTCILSLKLDRKEAALSALDFVLLENLEEVDLLNAVAMELASCSMHKHAVQVFRRSLSIASSSQTLKLLGDSLFLLGSKMEAKEAYDTVLGDEGLEKETLETVMQQVESISVEFGLGSGSAPAAVPAQ
ncbi:hypothetical protein HOP50_18g82250 [Chloropicon primus]|uniref:Uncharacterized protein n=1 Tax=Chloropicon primus TaxID=1764295 RepID=A0A5B8N1U9_9CHLO|nr:hypothetical protein A3770_18p82020 [Chloropicon primus]UPR04880.1 hypothetical protein HOP50_18g82250 [Chloropicon primus]|eukprot:QDZ25684.1 hypothetical protein A3770_18p82020 [Chloropicon primus]